MTTIKEILTLSLESIKSSHRNFICVAIKQHCKENATLEQECVKIMEKYKPKGKNDFIGWWKFDDRQSRIAALEKAIKELK